MLNIYLYLLESWGKNNLKMKSNDLAGILISYESKNDFEVVAVKDEVTS